MAGESRHILYPFSVNVDSWKHKYKSFKLNYSGLQSTGVVYRIRVKMLFLMIQRNNETIKRQIKPTERSSYFIL